MAQTLWRCCQGKGKRPFSTGIIAALAFLMLLTMSAEELYLASELLRFRHRSKPPRTRHPPKAAQGYTRFRQNRVICGAESQESASLWTLITSYKY